jgi:HJR/Mrr/RecB family endonuclease
MSQQGLPFTIDLTPVHTKIFGSSERVFACIRDDELQILGELLLAVDNRLDLRCVIPSENFSANDPKEIVAEYFPEIQNAGYSSRVVAASVSHSFLIIDQIVVVFGEGGVVHQSSRDSEHVIHHLRIFEKLTSLPEICEELFLDKEFLPLHEETSSEFEERLKSKFSHVQDLDDLLIKELAREPSALYKLDPRKFEEIIARITERNGYNVALTQFSRDGGRDIVARKSDWTGKELLLIECKRYAIDNRVQVGIVRSLFGVVEDEQATRGLIVTTSSFTKGAIQFADRHVHKLALNDYSKLVEQLRKFP